MNIRQMQILDLVRASGRASVEELSSGLKVTAQTIRRDLGELADGRLRLIGRADDLIATGGLKVSPHVVADAVARLPQVAECAVVVLPYLRGTHSGWLEMCRDLGVVVVAPDCGHFADQADQPGAVLSCRTGDGRDAARAAAQALGVAPLPWAGDRAAQAERIALRHRELLAEAGS